MSAAQTRVVLVRHGESACTVANVVGGHHGCTGLSEAGRAQARRLAARVSATGELAGASVLLASVLPRAVETAELLAPALGGLPVESDCAVCEQHPGEADGMTWEEADAAFGPSPWPVDPHRPFSPGGESWSEVIERVRARLDKLVADHAGETVVVACHGGVVRASLVAHLAPRDLTVLGLDAPANTSLTEWTHDPAGGWRLGRYNDAAHLSYPVAPG